VLNLQRLIFAGSPLSEVLTKIAQLVESQSEGMLCTIWLSGEEGNELHCAAALSLPGFRADVGIVGVGPKGHPAARRFIVHPLNDQALSGGLGHWWVSSASIVLDSGPWSVTSDSRSRCLLVRAYS